MKNYEEEDGLSHQQPTAANEGEAGDQEGGAGAGRGSANSGDDSEEQRSKKKRKLLRTLARRHRLPKLTLRKGLPRPWGGARGRARPNPPYKDTSVRKQEPDPTPKKDWGKDFAGIRNADKIWNEPEVTPMERWEEPLPNPNMMGLDEYETWAAKNIEEHSHPQGREAAVDEELQRQRELTNLEWILQERIETGGQATAMPATVAGPLAQGNLSLVNPSVLTNPMPGNLAGTAMPGLTDPVDPMRPVWFQEPIQQPSLEVEQELG